MRGRFHAAEGTKDHPCRLGIVARQQYITALRCGDTGGMGDRVFCVMDIILQGDIAAGAGRLDALDQQSFFMGRRKEFFDDDHIRLDLTQHFKNIMRGTQVMVAGFFRANHHQLAVIVQ